MEIVLARVDERLIHGKIINEWCQFAKPTHLLITDSELAQDLFMSNVYRALAPFWLETRISTEKDSAEYLKANMEEEGRVLILCKFPMSFVKLVKEGIVPEKITLADKRYFPNKIEIPIEYKIAINQLIDSNISVVAQEFPEDDSIEIEKYSI